MSNVITQNTGNMTRAAVADLGGDKSLAVCLDSKCPGAITPEQMIDQPKDSGARWMFNETARQLGLNPVMIQRGSIDHANVTRVLTDVIGEMKAEVLIGTTAELHSSARGEITAAIAKGAVQGAGAQSQKAQDVCNPVQRGGQAIGNFVVEVGGLAAQSGIGLGIAGTTIAAFGASRGSIPVTLLGVRALPHAAQLASIGGLVTAGGAALSAISGSGKDAVAELGSRVLTNRLPNGVVKDTVAEASANILKAALPDIKSCM